MKRDIPYEYRGGMKFFQRAHVKDVVCHLRLLANVKDEMAWVRVLGLQPGIGLVTAGKIIKQIQVFDTIDEVMQATFKLGSRASSGWTRLHGVLKKMLVGNRHPSDMIRAIAASDYRDYLEAEYPDFMDRLEDLEQFALFAESYTDLTTFLDEVSLTDEYGAARQEEGDQDEERIVLSTIHQAKGLEWDAVFVIHLSDGKFPNPRALEEKGGIEEERRLFYVAITRARKQLFLTYPITFGGESLFMSQPSMFLQEIPDELLEHVRLRRAAASRPTSSWDDDEAAIILDDLGETISKPMPTGGFLRNLDEL
jgi:DNA helicase-2/ATP-dependent DNA helicase PcrA